MFPAAQHPTRADLRAMLELALPVVGAQLGIMLMGVVDTIMVGHLSREALAATALGNLYFYVASVFGMGALMALDPVVAQAVGARDDDAITRAVQRGLVMATALGVLGSLLLYPAEPVLRLLGQQPEIIPDGARYARICIPGIFPFFWFIVFRQTLQAMKRVAPVLVVVGAANLVNVALNWALIYGHAGAPAMGVAGSAWATSISRWFMAVALLFVSQGAIRHHLLPLHRASLDWAPFSRMVRLGVPIGAQYALEYGAFAAGALLMGILGTTEIAAHQIAINLASLTFMVPMGISAATAVLVGQAIGGGDEAGARRAALAGMLCGVAFMCATAVVFLAAPTFFARIYTEDPAVLALAGALIPIAGVFQVFDGTQVVAGGVLRGVGDTKAPMVINVLGFWLVGIPVCAALTFPLGFGAIGLWWGIVVALATVATLLLLRVRSRLSRRMARVMIDEVPVAGTGD
jgi:MATE family multidrug resistance protein